jgi:hypothetical protein
VVEDSPSSPSTPPLPPVSSRDITSARRHSSWTEPETPTQRDRFDPSDLSPIGGGGGAGPAGSSPSSSNQSAKGLRRDRRQSDMSALSTDLGLRYTYVLRLLIYTPPRLGVGPASLARLLILISGLSTLCVFARADADCPYSTIRRLRPRTLTRTRMYSPRCKIRLGEVSLLQTHDGLFLRKMI